MKMSWMINVFKKKELSFSLSDLNILILGAKLGIGASLARICAEQNANVILVDKEEPIELADNLRQLAVGKYCHLWVRYCQ